ncbi:c-type cytochrome [Myroides sp. LJL119]
MKKTILLVFFIFSFVLLTGCGDKKEDNLQEKAPERVVQTQKQKLELGKDIFNGKGNCASCHLADKAVIGPSIKDILKVYDQHNADIIVFLKGESQAIVDPSKFVLMQPNLEITKKMSDNELQALLAYMRTM